MIDYDLRDLHQAGALFILSVAVFLVILGMDMRKVAPGKVKMVPWTFMSILAVLGMMASAKILFDAVFPPVR